jgi:hypothetical protein
MYSMHFDRPRCLLHKELWGYVTHNTLEKKVGRPTNENALEVLLCGTRYTDTAAGNRYTDML